MVCTQELNFRWLFVSVLYKSLSSLACLRQLLLHTEQTGHEPSSSLLNRLLLLQSTPGAYHTSIFPLIRGLRLTISRLLSSFLLFVNVRLVLILDSTLLDSVTPRTPSTIQLSPLFFHVSLLGFLLRNTAVNCLDICLPVLLDSLGACFLWASLYEIPQPASILLLAEHEPVTS